MSGKYHWVYLDHKGKRTAINSDTMKVDRTGALVFENRTDTVDHVSFVVAPGKWVEAYAASALDDTPIAWS